MSSWAAFCGSRQWSFQWLELHHALVVAVARRTARHHVFLIILAPHPRPLLNVFFKKGCAFPKPHQLNIILLRGGRKLREGGRNRRQRAGSLEAALTATSIAVLAAAVIAPTGREDALQSALPGPSSSCASLDVQFLASQAATLRSSPSQSGASSVLNCRRLQVLAGAVKEVLQWWCKACCARHESSASPRDKEQSSD